MADSRLRSIVFDCAKPSALARFWAAALGYTVRPYDQAEIDRLRAAGFTVETDPSVVIEPAAAGRTIWFNRVPEPKLAKNRVHIDLNLDRLEDVDQLVERGARVLRSADEVPRANASKWEEVRAWVGETHLSRGAGVDSWKHLPTSPLPSILPPWMIRGSSGPNSTQHNTPIGLTLLPTDTIEVTDPGHPLYGLTLPLIDITNKQNAGEACVVWIRPGIERIVPIAATNLAPCILPRSSCRVSVEAIRRLLQVVATIPELHLEDTDDIPSPDPTASALGRSRGRAADASTGHAIDPAKGAVANRPAGGSDVHPDDLANGAETITAQQREKRAYVYIRQSDPKQVRANVGSQYNQYALVERAVELGWRREQVHVIDGDQGHSSLERDRQGFQELVSAVSLGNVGMVFAYEASRLARNNADWYRLLAATRLAEIMIKEVV